MKPESRGSPWPVWLRPLAENAGVALSLAVQPRAPRSEIVGAHGDALKVRVSSPPVDGAANAALVSFLADLLDVKKGDVQVVRGLSGRRKIVEIRGIEPAGVVQALAAKL